jgi:hypothetical protein
MAVSRHRIYPPPGDFDVLGDVRDYLARLVAAIQDESYSRVEDFSYFNLNEKPWFDVQEYGCLGDDSHDDTTYFTAALDDAMAAKGVLYIPPGTYYLTTKLTVDTEKVTIIGENSRNCILKFYGCDGIEVTAPQVCLRDFMIWQGSGSGDLGLYIKGTHSTHIDYHNISNLWIYGWDNGAKMEYAWSNSWDGVVITQGLKGLQIFGQSVNNSFNGCIFSGDTSASSGSYSVELIYDSGKSDAHKPEGNVFDSCMMLYGESGVILDDCGINFFDTCIVDLMKVYGYHFKNSVDGGMNGTQINGGWVGILGAVNGTGIQVDAATAETIFGSISKVYLYSYAQTGLMYGISLGANNERTTIEGNKFRGFDQCDIYVDSTDNVITGNVHYDTGLTYKNIYIKKANNHVGDNHVPDGYKFDAGITNEYAIYNTPKARAYRNGEQSNIANGADTKVELNAESYDIGTDFDSSSDYDYTVPVAGKYRITAQIRLATGSFAVDERYILKVKQGANVILQAEDSWSTNTLFPTLFTADTLALAANDLITLYLYHTDAGDSVDIYGGDAYSTYMTIEYLGNDV